jgi:DNA helicase-2/ATP-dependent DNA helicase PcrA
MALISRAKSRGDTPTSLYASTSPSQASSQIEKQLRAVYDAYNSALRGNNSLDFDDLLLFGAKLLGQHSVLDVGHLFVDEL